MKELLGRIRAGQRISKSEIDAAIERINILIENAVKCNNPTAARRFADTRNTLANYRQIYQKRRKRDILKDLSDADEMIQTLEGSRNYEAAAKYRRLRDELQKEFDCAMQGKSYSPPAGSSRGSDIGQEKQEEMSV